ncbi:MAG: 1-acyl-sn-glycerol-3-phosphate acyltransferase [Clostridia bacterium]|nr:1-acyl-sn-glycerol-3-phosphate acyltransferase [Clostridia bacterium]
MAEKKTSPAYRFFLWLLYVFYPKMEICGAENLPDEPVVIVANHTQMNGPIACELNFPEKRYTWCAAQMMNAKEVPGYAFQDFWSQKPRATHWFYRLLSYAITPLSVLLFNNANTIPVYRDARILTTLRTTLNRLVEGANVVIFPEYDEKFNNILYKFQEGFVDVARLYQKKTGKELSFVPMYIAPRLKQMHFGKPIRFCSENPIEEERKRICNYLMQEITQIAAGLPLHTVIPYRNIPKRFYPTNIPIEVTNHEKTGC